MWSDYSGEETEAVKVDDTGAALAPEYLDVFVSAVREDDPFQFSVQILNSTSTFRCPLPSFRASPRAGRTCWLTGAGVASLEKLMSDFSLHHRSAAAAAPSTFSPKTGELVSAKFSEDDQW
jgi:staphylococcal nuclease domain-containing protein 1